MATKRIYYNARAFTSALTDIKIDIYNSANTKVTDAQTLSELGSTGVYYYDFTTSSTGTFYCIIDSASEPQAKTYEFTVSATSTAGSAGQYCTTLEVCEFLGIVRKIPEWTESSSPTRETVGTGDDQVLVFYLDHNNVIAGTYTLYYGSAVTTTTTLSETTHFTIDKENGKITLTTTGRTLLSTNNIYAEYKYIENNLGLNDEIISDLIDNASKDLESQCNRVFTETAVSEELIDTNENIDEYFTLFRPVVSLTHLYTTQTEEGSTESYTEITDTADYDLDLRTGRITILEDTYKPITRRRGLKISYVHGSSTVPVDIRRACLYSVVLDLVAGRGGKDIVVGNKDLGLSIPFYQNMLDKIIHRYQVNPMFNS